MCISIHSSSSEGNILQVDSWKISLWEILSQEWTPVCSSTPLLVCFLPENGKSGVVTAPHTFTRPGWSQSGEGARSKAEGEVAGCMLVLCPLQKTSLVVDISQKNPLQEMNAFSYFSDRDTRNLHKSSVSINCAPFRSKNCAEVNKGSKLQLCIFPVWGIGFC